MSLKAAQTRTPWPEQTKASRLYTECSTNILHEFLLLKILLSVGWRIDHLKIYNFGMVIFDVLRFVDFVFLFEKGMHA